MSITTSPLTPLESAAQWLAAKPVESVVPILSALMTRFHLSTPDAIRVVKRATVLRSEAVRMRRIDPLERAPT